MQPVLRAESLMTVSCQVVDMCLARYPSSAKHDAEVLKHSAAGSRSWRAAKVAAGEKALLQRLKKEALVLLMKTAAEEQDGDDHDEELGEDDEDDDEDDDELEDDVNDDPDGEDEDDDEDEEEEQPSKRRRTNQQHLQQPNQPAKQKHKHQHKHRHRHGVDGVKQDGSTRKPRQGGIGAADCRGHYGNMWGPKECDVWDSDDSDKVSAMSGRLVLLN